MEQLHLVVYLEAHGCVEVRQDKRGYIVMRNPTNGKINAVPVPSKGKFLKETTICQACQQLGVPLPPHSSPEIDDLLMQIKAEVEKRLK